MLGNLWDIISNRELNAMYYHRRYPIVCARGLGTHCQSKRQPEALIDMEPQLAPFWFARTLCASRGGQPCVPEPVAPGPSRQVPWVRLPSPS
jgi:hypothetical protein